MESVVIGNKEIVDVLSRLQLKNGEAQTGDNLRRCYEALVAAGIFPSAELELVELWLENFRLAATGKAAYARNTSETDSLRPGVENQPVARRRVIASNRKKC